ncbi:ParA family protein [uncultured Jatrophihabitans sp.]|uniref:ParA family protein n=1 Tax=uncultured Jatrophihabitans sp. TaxID=1610747 RepID=UPI0035CC8C37
MNQDSPSPGEPDRGTSLDLDEPAPDEVPRDRASDDLSDVSRETAAVTDSDVSRETTSALDIDAPDRERDVGTPIAREAAQAIHVLNVRQEHWPRPPKTRVLTVANQKGGVGKTTSAVNIAAALALHGQRVLLIDLDPQGNASTALGIEHGVGTPSIYDVLLGGRPVAEVAHTTDFAPLLQCVPATLDLAGADIELTSQVAREYRLQRALETYLEQAGDQLDYVLIDCPPSLGLLTLNALVAAREVLLPIQCEYYALEGLAQLLKTVELVTSHLNPQLEVTTVLLTMYDSRTRLADQVADEVRRHFGELVLAPRIPRNVRVSEAPGFGQTVITYDPGSRGAIGYLDAARELADRGAGSSVHAAEGSGHE